MRRRFTTSDASLLGPNDHAAWSGGGPEAMDGLAVSAFTSAASRGERMLFVSEQPHPDRLADLEDRARLMSQGALQLVSIEDCYRDVLDPPTQLAHFEEVLESALADGHTGICVVADNTPLAAGSDEEFAAWLAWEEAVETLQASRPVTGVCYFDRRQVTPERLADIAAIHPVLSTGFAEPSFQLFVDADVMKVVGAVDHFNAEQLRRVLMRAPLSGGLTLDLSELEFIDHRALMVLDEVAARGTSVRVRSAKPIVRRIWELLDLAGPVLEPC